VVALCVWASALALVVAVIAHGLIGLIAFCTNLFFYGRISTAPASPAGNHLGWYVIFIPVIGGIIVGLMARFGSKAIRGHGIPEAMEQVLLNESRIPARITLLKPISAAISIGTGGPFGAEGPIIATGGALGSLVGQVARLSTSDRKTLLAAGAAAGMAATFGSPVSAVLLAVELLLFEFRPRSVIPVAIASFVATGTRFLMVGTQPAFPMPNVRIPDATAYITYLALGCVMGVLAVVATRIVYWVEDLFEELPIHWMWWPAIGGIVVGVVGYFAPRTMGVGYDNIEHLVSGTIVGPALIFLCVMKFLSWSISLGSGTSGGTLAPLFTIGGAAGAAIGEFANRFAASVDIRMCALVGMAAIFAGASRAFLASCVFAFETTQQPLALVPLLGGCAGSYLISSLLMRNTIMTEKLARRGVRVPSEYTADFLDQLSVGDHCSRNVVSINADQTLGEVRAWLADSNPDHAHQGFPVVDDRGRLRGVITRRTLFDAARSEATTINELIERPASVVFERNSLRDAADHMVREKVGRLPVVSEGEPEKVVGFITRSDLLEAHARRLKEA